MNAVDFKRVLIGEPFPTSQEIHERLDKVRVLAVFASDPISSNTYATEAIIGVLIVPGSGALSMTHTALAQSLHNQTANLLQRRLCTLQDVILIDVPYHLASSNSSGVEG